MYFLSKLPVLAVPSMIYKRLRLLNKT